jgi:hypothetical protein
MSKDIEQRLSKVSELFILQLAASADVCDFSQLFVFILVVFSSGNIKEELLKEILLHDESRSEENCRSFYDTLLGRNLCQSPQMGLQLP